MHERIDFDSCSMWIMAHLMLSAFPHRILARVSVGFLLLVFCFFGESEPSQSCGAGNFSFLSGFSVEQKKKQIWTKKHAERQKSGKFEWIFDAVEISLKFFFAVVLGTERCEKNWIKKILNSRAASGKPFDQFYLI